MRRVEVDGLTLAIHDEGEGPPVLFAHDMGSVMSWQFCMRDPGRIDRYVAMSVGHPSAYTCADPLRGRDAGLVGEIC